MQNKIKILRTERGLTQAELAEKVGIRRETMLYLEQGKYNPSLKLAFEVARELGKEIGEVFQYE